MGGKRFSVTAGEGGYSVIKKERYFRDKGWAVTRVSKESANEGDVRVLAALAVGVGGPSALL